MKGDAALKTKRLTELSLLTAISLIIFEIELNGVRGVPLQMERNGACASGEDTFGGAVHVKSFRDNLQPVGGLSLLIRHDFAEKDDSY